MTRDEKSLWNYAVRYATRMGFRNDAEDFAQECLLKIQSGRRSSVENLFIDFIRSQQGRFKEKRTAKAREMLSYDLFNERVHGRIEEGNSLTVSLAENLDGQEKAIFCLRYLWGFTELEIAYCFGLTEYAVCHRLRKTRKILKDSVKK